MTHKHGGNIYEHKNAADFSANINFLGMPDSVRRAALDAIDASIHYPEPGSKELRQILAKRENVSADQVICGNGAAEILFSLCHALKPKKALLPGPTFAEYEQALVSVDCEVEHVLLKEEHGFALQEDFVNWLHKDLDMVFLCNPNNPTGISIDRDLLFRILRICREMEIFLVVDECFLDFVKEPEKHSLKAQLSQSLSSESIYKALCDGWCPSWLRNLGK